MKFPYVLKLVINELNVLVSNWFKGINNLCDWIYLEDCDDESGGEEHERVDGHEPGEPMRGRLEAHDAHDEAQAALALEHHVLDRHGHHQEPRDRHQERDRARDHLSEPAASSID